MTYRVKLLGLISAIALTSGCVVVSTGPAPARDVPAPRASQLVGHEDMNSFRAAHGRGPVIESKGTARAARRHVQDLAANDFISHTGSDGSNAGERLTEAGCKGTRAENIAWGQRNRAAVMKEWINSPGHRKNMLLANVNFYSIERINNIWVMTLATDC